MPWQTCIPLHCKLQLEESLHSKWMVLMQHTYSGSSWMKVPREKGIGKQFLFLYVAKK